MKNITFAIVMLAGALIFQGCDVGPGNDPEALNDSIRSAADQYTKSDELKKIEMRARIEEQRALQKKRRFARKFNDALAVIITGTLLFGYVVFLGMSAKMGPGRRFVYPILGLGVYCVLMVISPTGYGPGAAYGKAYTIMYALMALGIYLLVIIVKGVGQLITGTKKGHNKNKNRTE